MKPLSDTMWLALNYMSAHGHGSALATRQDPTYCALERRGLVYFERTGSKYGRSRWRITEAGISALTTPNKTEGRP